MYGVKGVSAQGCAPLSQAQPCPAPHLSVRMFSYEKTYAAACDEAAARTSSTSLALFSLRAGLVFVSDTSFARFDLGIVSWLESGGAGAGLG